MSTNRHRLTPRLLSRSWMSFLLLLWLSPLTTSAANLTGLNITPPNLTIQAGKTVQLTATGSYDDGTQQIIAQARQVSAGGLHTCAVSTDGTIKCWGANSLGQLGNGTTTDSPIPVTVSDISTAVAVSAGGKHTCALLADGTVRCWGNNFDGQLGNVTFTLFSLTPVTVSGISTAVAISAGSAHTCAVLADSTIKCWGRNHDGVLGYGTSPVVISGINTAVAVSAGKDHSCAVLTDGTLRCWGHNNSGQLGNGTTFDSSIPVTVVGISTATVVSAGGNHTCAALIDLTVRCWGGSGKQLGNGLFEVSWTPVTVMESAGVVFKNAVTITAGGGYTCAMISYGQIRCWGSNFSGELGNGTTTDSLTPASASGIDTAVAVSAGSNHACAVLADGTIKCWGDNTYGDLGNGLTTTDSSIPVAVIDISNAMTVSAGDGHTCAVIADGAARCWGNNNSGQLGNGTTTSSSAPVAVSGLSTAVAIAAGKSHTCALLADGKVQCWGNGIFIPTTVSGLSTAVAVSVGGDYACAILADGTIKCWGYNSYGQLGNYSTASSLTPVTVFGISTAVAISAGSFHACALLVDKTLRCWGFNGYGQLGNSAATYIATAPVAVNSINTAVAVSAGGFHTCAVLADGTIRCWGSNDYGELGNGTISSPTSIPVTVSSISTAVAVSAGFYNTCAVLSDGTLQCWGHNNAGQLGNDTTLDSAIPVTVSGISTAVVVSTDRFTGDHVCTLLVEGTLRCWGYNNYGQLGIGMYGSSYPTPALTLGYLPLAWDSSNYAAARVNGVGVTQALNTGTALITARLNGLNASTLVTVSPVLKLDGFWPGTASPGQFVFLFGQGFVPQQTKVQINGIPVSFVQVADPTLLFLMLPPGDTRGPITITTPSGSVTSSLSFNTPLTGVNITGLWPSIVSPGQLVFVFGSGFVTNATTATVNSIKAPVLQVLDPTLLFFMAPSTPTTGFVTVTTSAGTATSASPLTIK